MVFECKIIGAIFLVLVDLHRDKSTKVKKNLRTSLFAIRDKCAPKHQRPNALVLGLDTNIAKNVLNFFLEILIKVLNFLKNLLNFSEISFFSNVNLTHFWLYIN